MNNFNKYVATNYTEKFLPQCSFFIVRKQTLHRD